MEKIIDGKRYYYSHEYKKAYPSVTTRLKLIAKDGLVFWQKNYTKNKIFDYLNGNEFTKEGLLKVLDDTSDTYAQEKADYGTEIHGLISKHIKLCLEKTAYSLCPKLGEFYKWETEYKPEFISTEKYVIDDVYNYGFRYDFLCKINGVLTLVDIKTGSQIGKLEGLQLSAYAQALIPSPEDLYILHIPKDKPFKFKKYDYCFREFAMICQLWDYFNNWTEKKARTAYEKYLDKREENNG